MVYETLLLSSSLWTDIASRLHTLSQALHAKHVWYFVIWYLIYISKYFWFLIFLGIYNTNTTIAVFAILSMIFGSIYSLWLYNRVCYGNIQINYISLYQDLNKREFVMFLLILVLVFIIGIYPTFILDYLNIVKLIHY